MNVAMKHLGWGLVLALAGVAGCEDPVVVGDPAQQQAPQQEAPPEPVTMETAEEPTEQAPDYMVSYTEEEFVEVDESEGG